MRPQQLSINDFNYELPPEKIALYPAAERDHSRLLHYRNGTLSSHHFFDLPGLLPSHSLLLLNNTRVVQARLLFRKPTGGHIELFCLEPANAPAGISEALLQQSPVTCHCLIGGASKWKPGERLSKEMIVQESPVRLSARYLSKQEDHFLIEFSWTPDTLCFAELLEAAGTTPLPPYIKRQTEAHDRDRYQTVYAGQEGSVAAPTAGLHFTPAVFDQLKARQITCGYVTLHVGAGTFKPVQADQLWGHTMHREYIEVDLALLDQLLAHLDQRITVVGTTTLRTVESLYWMGVKLLRNPQLGAEGLQLSQWEPYELEDAGLTSREALRQLRDWMCRHHIQRLITTTQILIAPGFRFHIAHQLITNFHQPRSTLLLLVAAGIGADWRKVYDYALQHDYRFLSYGDASLLEFR